MSYISVHIKDKSSNCEKRNRALFMQDLNCVERGFNFYKRGRRARNRVTDAENRVTDHRNRVTTTQNRVTSKPYLNKPSSNLLSESTWYRKYYVRL